MITTGVYAINTPGQIQTNGTSSNKRNTHKWRWEKGKRDQRNASSIHDRDASQLTLVKAAFDSPQPLSTENIFTYNDKSRHRAMFERRAVIGSSSISWPTKAPPVSQTDTTQRTWLQQRSHAQTQRARIIADRARLGGISG